MATKATRLKFASIKDLSVFEKTLSPIGIISLVDGWFRFESPYGAAGNKIQTDKN